MGAEQGSRGGSFSLPQSMVPVTSVQAVFSGANVSPRACRSVPAGHGGCFQSEAFLTRPGHTRAFCLVLFSLSDVGLVALLCGVIRVVAR